MRTKADLTVLLLAEASQHVTAMQAELDRLSALVATRDRQIEDMRDAIAERDTTIVELQSMVMRSA